MSVTCCQQKIPLFHMYYNLFPIDVNPSNVGSITEAIIYSFFVLKLHYGLEMSKLLSFILLTFPQYNENDVIKAINTLLYDGVLVTLEAICVDWCNNQCPPKKFAISRNFDKLIKYQSLLVFMLQLAGGTRVNTPIFTYWFLPNRNLQAGEMTTGIKKPVFSSILP